MQNFFWGTATSAFQIEGGHNIDGRSPSIWDVFSLQNGRIKNHDDGRNGINHYKTYQNDLTHLAKLGVNSYRFSLSWSRIIPTLNGEVNKSGLAFYDRILDELEKYKITPFITLYHWDLPQYLQDIGGWLNPKTVEAFAHYVAVVVQHFGSRCLHYITLNEPQCIVNLGHRTLEHAPGIYLSDEQTVKIVHHLLLAHGHAVTVIRKLNVGATVGIANTSTVAIPVANTSTNIELARRHYFSLERGRFDQVTLFSDPVFLGRYPQEFIEFYEQFLPENYKKDLEIISQDIEYCYQNFYTGYFIAEDKAGNMKILPYTNENYTGVFPWLHYVPETLYYGPKFLFERYQKPIIISENGISVVDKVTSDKKVHDVWRIKYFSDYISALLKIKKEGVPVLGYFAWSLFDNFEWAWGYQPRFGLIYIDYLTQERIYKDSFYFYQNLIKTKMEKI
ncbi:MAG: family 1 glycosylhydrolase [Bacilli bacterium]|jgi:beta-glucosidase|nr:family 1 glycosylhydrolase [Bacilli bacterium]MDD3388742.1 family 1 glycosylhydrolase [Bacilli bacterium]MDD4344532.1 family 1 glycosylhydrolase [Bacilli bacterium]MDD4520426.1 family 1 glycosylhydrolase [Bacilli bacterium]MDY0399159.1 family 1 glycosylhydrolase [Bacilli bacterium]